MCHEIGHAIQHAQNYSPLITRTKLVKNYSMDKQNKYGNNLHWIPFYFRYRIFITNENLCLNNTTKHINWSNYSPDYTRSRIRC